MRSSKLNKAGKVAVVTGAANGIGQAYAVRLAQDGADVVILDRLEASETEALVRATGGKEPASFRCDITDHEAVRSTAQAILQKKGRCDILVNNAGVGSVRPLDTVDYERLRTTLAINLEGAFLLCKAFIPSMRANGWGRIVNISTSMLNSAVSNFADYVTAKGGVVGLTRALASDLGSDGITVNAIAPGLVRTPLTVHGRDGHLPLPEEVFEMARQMQPIKRTMQPVDLVGTLSFLTSDDAAFLTGQVIHVDGGVVRA